jgi:hypothetical protein
MNRKCNNNEYIFTLYVDDLTISGPKIDGPFKHDIRTIISRNELQHQKERHFKKHDGREITGVIVNSNSIEVPRRRHKAAYEIGLELRMQIQEEEEDGLFRRLMSRFSEGSQIEKKFSDMREKLKEAKANIFKK